MLRKEILMQLSKEQLIYLIKQFEEANCMIGEICVSESKLSIKSHKAVSEIRKYLYRPPTMFDATELKAFIDSKMDKISKAEYRKIIGLDDQQGR